MKQAASRYQSLSADEKEYFRQQGLKGTLAWRQGFCSFGEKVSEKKADNPSIGKSSDSLGGALVAIDDGRSSQLVPLATRDLREDVRLIRKRFREHRKVQSTKRDVTEDQLLKTFKASKVMEAPPCFDVDNVFTMVHRDGPVPGLDSDDMVADPLLSIKWFPPVSEFVQAGIAWSR